MSSPAFQIRSGRIRAAVSPGRASGLAGVALQRARLTVVPRARTRTSPLPFVTLVSFVMLAGVIGLLMFNTSMQQAAFTTTALEQQAATLDAREQTLRMELDTLRDPQRVALQAQRMGMVIPASPAFLRLRDGKVLGTPAPAVRDGALRLLPQAPPKPAVLDPAPNVVTVIGEPPVGGANGAGDGRGHHGHGKNKHHGNPGHGAARPSTHR
jgi:cell division protein FtsB